MDMIFANFAGTAAGILIQVVGILVVALIIRKSIMNRMKKCAHCASAIPKEAKICPKCRTNLANP